MITHLSFIVIAVVAGSLCTLPRTAEAQPPNPTLSPPPPPQYHLVERTESYGGQIVLADLASLALIVGANNSFSSDLAGLSLLTFVTFSPAVHFAHNNVRGGLRSFGLHVFAPLFGAWAGYQLDNATCGKDEWFCGLGGLVLGGLLGIVSATVIDASVLAKTTVRQAPLSRGYSLAPRLSMSPHGGFTLGLGGTM